MYKFISYINSYISFEDPVGKAMIMITMIITSILQNGKTED